jgi:HEPN domain-containing protein
MSAAQNLQVQILFIKSAEDEATLAFGVPDSVFEFHVQQAVEKLLKALITAHGAVHPYTHDLQLLINQLGTLGETLPDFGVPLPTLSPFGVIARYDLGVPLTAEERQEFREVVAAVHAFVRARVDALP